MAGTAVRNYIVVDCIDEAVGKVEALGGTITEPKAEIPGQGWFAIGTDSEGNPIAPVRDAAPLGEARRSGTYPRRCPAPGDDVVAGGHSVHE